MLKNALKITLILTFFFIQSICTSLLHNSKEKICEGGRVTKISELSELRGCDVIEGNLIFAFKIVNSSTEWITLQAREITGYLIFYMVDDLSTLSTVLPNLRVIRGDKLFYNQALIIYGVFDLKNVGLHNLTSILRGSINIQSNPLLDGYVRKVDWDNITVWNSEKDSPYTNYIQGVNASLAFCAKKCRKNDQSESFCWSKDVCQKKNSVSNALNTEEKCSPDCVGGCQIFGKETKCFSCRHFRSNDTCARSCFPLFEYKNYRCITEKECWSKGRKLVEFTSNNRRECVAQCPPGYKVTSKNTNICLPCRAGQENCEKKCSGGYISSLEKLQQFSGCTHIVDSIEIRMAGKNVVDELRKNLGSIEEVFGFVRVFKSDDLESLDFLNNLSVIKGEKLWKNSFSLVIDGNENLERLWNVTKSEFLKIEKGEALIHSNHKLCEREIENLLSTKVWENSVSDKSLKSFLNGNKKVCNIATDFDFTLSRTEERGEVEISFHRSEVLKRRINEKIVGFVVNFADTEKDLKNYYDKIDWKQKFFKYAAGSDLNEKISELYPNTRYAFYLEAHTTDSIGAFTSKIKYVTTSQFNPDPPKNIRIKSRGTNYIGITWDPPPFSYGQIDRYMVTIEKMESLIENEREILNEMNICDKEGKSNLQSQMRYNSDSTNYHKNANDALEANTMKIEILKEEHRKKEWINLSKKLARLLYTKEPLATRSKRDTTQLELARYCGKEENSAADTNNQKHNYSRRDFRTSAGGDIKKSRIGRGKRSANRNISKNDRKNNDSTSTNRASHSKISKKEIPNNLSFEDLTKIHLLKSIRSFEHPSLKAVIPILERPEALSETCQKYLLVYVERLIKEFESVKTSASRIDLKSCSEVLPESNTREVCRLPSDKIELTSESKINVTDLKHPSYRVKIKACQNLNNSNCGNLVKEFPCQLCSFTYSSKIIYNLEEKENLALTAAISNVSDNGLLVSWDLKGLTFKQEVLGYDIVIKNADNKNESKDLQNTFRYCVDSTFNESWLKVSKPGNYSIEIIAFSVIRNELAKSELIYCEIKDFLKDDNNVQRSLTTFFSFFLAFLILLAIVGVLYLKLQAIKRREKYFKEMETALNRDYDTSNIAPHNPLWRNHLEYKIDPKYIHSIENLTILGHMDDGKFGTVSQGQLKVVSGAIPVGIKSIKPGIQEEFSNQLSLIEEASLMLKVKSYHLVRAFGMVTSDTDLYLIMELMHHGSLSRYIKVNGDSENIFNLFTLQQVMKICLQIADGMAYLNSKGILHMDLASRNCLLDGDLNVKVSDFGLSKITEGDYYKFRTDRMAPLRWMPPEYFTQNKFTTQSDVWSYAIVLWEIFNPKKTPYENLHSIEEFNKNLSLGMTLADSIPVWIPYHLTQLATKCWNFEPKKRPTFKMIVNELLKHSRFTIKEEFKSNSFCYCGEITESSDYYSSTYAIRRHGLSNDENDVSGTLLINSPVVTAPNWRNKLFNRNNNGVLSKKLHFQKWRNIFSTIQDQNPADDSANTSETSQGNSSNRNIEEYVKPEADVSSSTVQPLINIQLREVMEKNTHIPPENTYQSYVNMQNNRKDTGNNCQNGFKNVANSTRNDFLNIRTYKIDKIKLNNKLSHSQTIKGNYLDRSYDSPTSPARSVQITRKNANNNYSPKIQNDKIMQRTRRNSETPSNVLSKNFGTPTKFTVQKVVTPSKFLPPRPKSSPVAPIGTPTLSESKDFNACRKNEQKSNSIEQNSNSIEQNLNTSNTKLNNFEANNSETKLKNSEFIDNRDVWKQSFNFPARLKQDNKV